MDEMNAATIPQETENVSEQVAEGTTETNEVQEQPSEPFLSVKYNKEDVALDKDKAVEYAQKGMNYDKVYEQLEGFKNSKGLKYLENIAQKSNTSIDELVDYWQEQEEIQVIKDLAEKSGLSDEVAERLYHLEKREKEREAKDNEYKAEQEKKQAYTDFLEFYKEEYGDYPKDNDISEEVWRIQEETGKSVKDAFIEYERNKFKAELSKINQSNEVQQKNEANKETSPGSISGQDKIPNDFISYEEVKANENNPSWINKNLDNIKKSMPHWKR